MKAGLVANLFALKALTKAGIDPGGSVTLQSVIEEEDGGGGGALACMLDGSTADGMIVTEPAPWVTVALAGIRRFMVRVQGKPAHPAESQKGVNAIGKMLLIYEALEALDAHRKATVRYTLFELTGNPAAHLIAGTLNAGDHISTVAGFAEMGCRIGYIPGETEARIRELVIRTIEEAAAQDDWLRTHPPVIEWLPIKFDPWYQDPSDPFVTTVMDALSRVPGEEAPVRPMGNTWSDDSRMSQYFGFPAVCFGPRGGRFHGVDEFVELDSVIHTAKAVALATLAWCSQDRLAT